jgi:hypothetical protein
MESARWKPGVRSTTGGRQAKPRRKELDVKKCLNCRCYDRRNAKPNDNNAPMWGECRRHSPRVNPVTARAYVVEGVWPRVRDDDWCGEWRALTRAVGDPVPREEATATPVIPPRERFAPAAAAAVGDD